MPESPAAAPSAPSNPPKAGKSTAKKTTLATKTTTQSSAPPTTQPTPKQATSASAKSKGKRKKSEPSDPLTSRAKIPDAGSLKPEAIKRYKQCRLQHLDCQFTTSAYMAGYLGMSTTSELVDFVREQASILDAFLAAYHDGFGMGIDPKQGTGTVAFRDLWGAMRAPGPHITSLYDDPDLADFEYSQDRIQAYKKVGWTFESANAVGRYVWYIHPIFCLVKGLPTVFTESAAGRPKGGDREAWAHGCSVEDAHRCFRLLFWLRYEARMSKKTTGNRANKSVDDIKEVKSVFDLDVPNYHSIPIRFLSDGDLEDSPKTIEEERVQYAQKSATIGRQFVQAFDRVQLEDELKAAASKELSEDERQRLIYRLLGVPETADDPDGDGLDFVKVPKEDLTHTPAMPRYQSDVELKGLLETLYRHCSVICDAFPSNKPTARALPTELASDPDFAPSSQLNTPLDLNGLGEDMGGDLNSTFWEWHRAGSTVNESPYSHQDALRRLHYSDFDNPDAHRVQVAPGKREEAIAQRGDSFNTFRPSPQQHIFCAWAADQEASLIAGGINTDACGTGKTLGMLTHIAEQAEALERRASQLPPDAWPDIDFRPTLICVPNSVIVQWVNEWRDHYKDVLEMWVIYGDLAKTADVKLKSRVIGSSSPIAAYRFILETADGSQPEHARHIFLTGFDTFVARFLGEVSKEAAQFDQYRYKLPDCKGT